MTNFNNAPHRIGLIGKIINADAENNRNNSTIYDVIILSCTLSNTITISPKYYAFDIGVIGIIMGSLNVKINST